VSFAAITLCVASQRVVVVVVVVVYFVIDSVRKLLDKPSHKLLKGSDKFIYVFECLKSCHFAQRVICGFRFLIQSTVASFTGLNRMTLQQKLGVFPSRG
jgi:hypothetical protein